MGENSLQFNGPRPPVNGCREPCCPQVEMSPGLKVKNNSGGAGVAEVSVANDTPSHAGYEEFKVAGSLRNVLGIVPGIVPLTGSRVAFHPSGDVLQSQIAPRYPLMAPPEAFRERGRLLRLRGNG